MKSRTGILLVLLLAAAGLAVWQAQARPERGLAAPEVYSSPINGGCYIAAPNDCRLHVDPFTINIAAGARLVAFQLQANGATIYNYTTDVSNPPPSGGSTYSPSLVAQDFAAVCGETYFMNILGKDSADTSFLNMGQTASFTCPASVP